MAPKLMLATILFLALAGCQQDLYTNLSERSANEMIAALAANGVQASRQGEGAIYRVTVAEESFGRALEILTRLGYPRESYRNMDDVFPGDRMIQTPFEQRARFSYALGQEFARSIAMLDGVTFARVHVVLPETDIRGAPRGKPSASVVVRYRAGGDAGALAAQAKSIVASGLQGSDYHDIGVVLSPATDSPIELVQTAKVESREDASPIPQHGGEFSFRWFGAVVVAGAAIALGLGVLLLRKRPAL